MPKVKQEQVTRLEGEINNLWGELNTVNIPHNTRILMEKQMQEVEVEFKAVLQGKGSAAKLEKKLAKLDFDLAHAAVLQAENEISKTQHEKAPFQGLENVKHGLKDKSLTPLEARHEVKKITRKYS